MLQPNGFVLFRLGLATALLVICAAGLPMDQLAEAEEYVKAHTRVRAAAGLSPLQWDWKLAAYAKRLAFELQAHGHSSENCSIGYVRGFTSYGANWVEATYMPSPEEVVKRWVEGLQFYDYHWNSCSAKIHARECEEYKQVMWKKTVDLGCGWAECGNGFFIVCLYNPGSDIRGQRPY